MTLSPESRREAVDHALSLMLKELGDKALDTVLFDRAAAPFNGVSAATWGDLEDLQIVRRDEEVEGAMYRLTGLGWTEALRYAGTYDSPQLEKQLGRLSAHLKRKVKGRQRPETASVTEVTSETGFAEGWVYNVIESNLLELKFGRRGAKWHRAYPGRVIVIPVTFGIEAVDAEATLRAKIDQLEAELAARDEQLSEFLCPHCGAPMVTQAAVPNEYGDALYQSFECGYASTEGQIDHPCPSSPAFPPFSEYELMFREELKEDRRFRWWCWAKPKKPRARLLSLPEAPGETQEAAANAVFKEYCRYARPWKDRRR